VIWKSGSTHSKPYNDWATHYLGHRDASTVEIQLSGNSG